MNDEISQGTRAIIQWGVAIILLLLVGALSFAILQPFLVKLQTDAAQNSQGYIETKQGLLFSLIEDYQDLETQIVSLGNSDMENQTRQALQAQQASIVNRVQSEAALLDPQYVPQDVQAFLNAHQGE